MCVYVSNKSWSLLEMGLGTPNCNIIQINFEDHTTFTATIILFIPPVYNIFNTLGNPAQVKPAPPPDMICKFLPLDMING